MSWSDGRAFAYLLHHYHPQLVRRDVIRDETTQTQDNESQSHRDSDSNFTFSFVADQNQGRIENTKRTKYVLEFLMFVRRFSDGDDEALIARLLDNERSNVRHVTSALHDLGGVPFMLRPADLVATIPDEKVVITCLSHICARVLDLRQEVHAARVIQATWRAFRHRRRVKTVQVSLHMCSIITRIPEFFHLWSI